MINHGKVLHSCSSGINIYCQTDKGSYIFDLNTKVQIINKILYAKQKLEEIKYPLPLI